MRMRMRMCSVRAERVDGVIEEDAGTSECGGIEGVAFEGFFPHVTLEIEWVVRSVVRIMFIGTDTYYDEGDNDSDDNDASYTPCDGPHECTCADGFGCTRGEGLYGVWLGGSSRRGGCNESDAGRRGSGGGGGGSGRGRRLNVTFNQCMDTGK
jgi:hypothetical protein